MLRIAALFCLLPLSLAALAAPPSAPAPDPTAAPRAALARAGRTHGPDSREVADASAALFDALRADYRLDLDADEAQVLARREVGLRRALDGEHSLAYARALARLGYALAAVHADDEAAEQFAQAKAVVDALGDAAPLDARAEAALDLGYARRNQRTKFAEAVALIEDGLAKGKTLPPLRIAQANLWICVPYLYMGKPDLSVAALDRAEQALAAARQPQHPLHADLLRQRAQITRERGEPAQALALMERALASAKAARPYSAQIESAVMHTRGQMETANANLAAAFPWYEQVIAREEPHPTAGGYTLAMAHFELCNALGPAGRPKDALPHCRAAIERLEHLPAPPAVELSAAYSTYGIVISQTVGDDESVEPLLRSLDYAAKTGLNTAWAYSAEVPLAQVRRHQKKFPEAIALLRAGLTRLPPHGDFSTRANSRGILQQLALALWGDGQTAAGFDAARDLERSAALVRRLLAADLGERRALDRTTYQDGVPIMLAIAAQTHDPEQARAAWDALQERRGIAGLAAARGIATARASADPKLAGPWQRWQQTNAALAQARVALARAPSDATHAALTNADRDFEAAELALAAATGEAGARLAAARRSIADVAAALPPHAALVTYVDAEQMRPEGYPVLQTGPQLMYALVAEGKAPPRLVTLGARDEIDPLVETWYRLVSDRGSDAHAVSAAARALRGRVWDPIATTLKGERVFLLPSPTLARVSFAALERDDGHYVLETGPTLHYLDHERDLLANAPAAATKPTLLLAGAPRFAASGAAALRGDCPGLRDAPFQALPGAEAELEGLKHLATDAGVAPQTLEGSEASEAHVRAALAGHSIVHFATHGVFLGGHCAAAAGSDAGTRGISTVDTKAKNDSPLAPLSALVFSGADVGSDKGDDDGLLTSEEIQALDLGGVDWAVLSACETALGKTRADEGVLGLRRAFHLAGARTVIMSLWRVDDAATASFMQELYRARLRQHASTDVALQTAMRATLKARRTAGESTHPAYWAAFIAAGAWK